MGAMSSPRGPPPLTWLSWSRSWLSTASFPPQTPPNALFEGSYEKPRVRPSCEQVHLVGVRIFGLHVGQPAPVVAAIRRVGTAMAL